MALDPREAYRRSKLGLPITDTPINGDPDPIADNDAIWGKLLRPRKHGSDDQEELTPGDAPDQEELTPGDAPDPVSPREAYRRAKLGLPITDRPITGKPDPITDSDEIWGKLSGPRKHGSDDQEELTPGDAPDPAS